MINGLWQIKTCLVTLMLSLTLGAWAMFARHDGGRFSTPGKQRDPVVSKELGVLLHLPPIPPLVPPPPAALLIPDSSAGHAVELPPIPALSLPSPLPPIPTVASPARPLRPIARTRSSR